MTKNILLALLFLATSTKTFAHFLWLETNPTGKVNQKQEVKIFYGEYADGSKEKVGGEAFEKMKNFTLWAVSPSGEKTELKVEASDLYYKTSFTPKMNGTYTLILDNNKIDVMDYSQYNFGIFKTHYHALTKVEIGTKPNDTKALNPEGISIVDLSKKVATLKGEVSLQVLYKGEPMAKKEVDVFIADSWIKKITTDEKGMITFALPWNAQYVVEVTHKEEVPGKYNGKDYEFIFHSTSYAIPLK